MTPAEIIYDRRDRVIERAAEVGVTQACRENGVSRTTYYRWEARAERYGLSALMPKERRRPHVSTQTPPTRRRSSWPRPSPGPPWGPRRLLEHLADRSVHRSGSGVQKILNRHRLGTRRERVAALAALTAAENGLVAPRALEPFGFCLWASRPGDLVGLDCFYVGKLKGIGPIWQLTAVDTNTRWAFAELVVGHVSAKVAAKFLHKLARETWRAGFVLSGVLTDNGPEFIGRDFKAAVAEQRHRRAVPRHGAPGVLPAGLPPPPVRPDGRPPGGPARLPRALQHPSTQPRRVHEGQDSVSDAEGDNAMSSRVHHLSPQPVARTY